MGNTLGPLVSGLVLKATGGYAAPLIMQVGASRVMLVHGLRCGMVGANRRHPPANPTPTHTYLPQLALCLLILALLGWWVQESLDPRDKPREPFNLCRTHNTLAVLYQFLLTYRSVGHAHARTRYPGSGWSQPINSHRPPTHTKK